MPIACAAMGMILLAGIVVNNSILLVNFIKTARSNGADIHTAIEEAIRRRDLLLLNEASFRGRGILVAYRVRFTSRYCINLHAIAQLIYLTI